MRFAYYKEQSPAACVKLQLDARVLEHKIGAILKNDSIFAGPGCVTQLGLNPGCVTRHSLAIKLEDRSSIPGAGNNNVLVTRSFCYYLMVSERLRVWFD